MASTQPTLTTMRRFFRMLRTDRSEIGYIYLYAVFAGVINLSLPLGIQAILNFIQGGAVSSSWWLLIIIVTLGTLMAGVLVMMQLSVSETLQRRIFTRVAFDFAKRLPNLKTESIRGEYLPELVNRFFDTVVIQKNLPKVLIDLSTAAMQIVLGLILLAFYNSLFIVFGLILLIVLAIIFWVSGPIGLKTSMVESKYKYAVAHWLEELGRTIHTFKLAGSTDLPLQKTDKLVASYLDARKAHFRILLIQYASVVGFKTLVTGVLLSLGGWLVISNQINLGQFVAAELIILLVINSSEKLITTMELVYDLLTSLEKVGGVADLPVEADGGVDFSEISTGKGIALDLVNVSHQFGDSETEVIHNINLRIKSGEKIVVAGYSGSGKTTLVQIISGFLTNSSGQILYNGVTRGNLNINSVRAAIGDYSSQEDIFRGTLRENITLGNTNISFERLVEVAQAVGLDSFVNVLPKGYDTPLLPEGKGISRSTILKIILCRCIIIKPCLLAIEEMMANLEYSDRFRIANLLTNKDNEWTIVAVTDDPILASRCDRIVIMQDGRIVDEGTFEQIQNSIHYNKVFKITEQ